MTENKLEQIYETLGQIRRAEQKFLKNIVDRTIARLLYHLVGYGVLIMILR